MASHSESTLNGAQVGRLALESCRRLESLLRAEQQPCQPHPSFHWSAFFDQLAGDAPEPVVVPRMVEKRPRRPARIVGYSAHAIADTSERALPPIALTMLGMAAMGTIGLSSAWLPGTSTDWALGDSLLAVDEAMAAPATKKTARNDHTPDRVQAFASVQPLGHGATGLDKDWPLATVQQAGSNECQMGPATTPRG